jgi:hypothetical protein
MKSWFLLVFNWILFDFTLSLWETHSILGNLCLKRFLQVEWEVLSSVWVSQPKPTHLKPFYLVHKSIPLKHVVWRGKAWNSAENWIFSCRPDNPPLAVRIIRPKAVSFFKLTGRSGWGGHSTPSSTPDLPPPPNRRRLPPLTTGAAPAAGHLGPWLE